MREDLRNLLPQLDAEIEEMRQMRESALEEATKGDNPMLAEAAQEVQKGRMTMLEAVSSPAYRDEFEKSIDAFVKAFEETSTEETDEPMGERSESDDAVTKVASGASGGTHVDPDEDDDAFSDSLLIDATPSREKADAPRETWDRR